MSSEPYVLKLPYTMFGATMRVVDPKEPETAFLLDHTVLIHADDYFPVVIGLSYPCHKNYNFMMGPPMWHDCTAEGAHGHFLASCDDGTARFPHIIRSQADVTQFLDDLVSAKMFDVFLGETSAWKRALEVIFERDSVIKNLPSQSAEPPKSWDVSRIGWWM